MSGTPSRRSGARLALGATTLLALAVVVLGLLGSERLTAHGLFPNVDYQAYHLAAVKIRLGLGRGYMYPRPDSSGRPASFMRADRSDIARVNDRLPPALHLSEESGAYLYPPLVAVLVAPLTVFPVETAGVLWRVVLMASAACGLAFLYRALTLRWGTDRSTAIAVLAACVATWPFLYSIRLGQASALVFAAVAVAVASLAERRLALAGVAVGIGVLLKLLPGLMVLALLARGVRRALLAAVLTIVIGTLATSLIVSPLDFWRFFQGMSLNVHEAAGRSNNQSLLGLFTHLAYSPETRVVMYRDASLLSPAVRLAAYGAAALMLAAAAWHCLRPSRRRAQADPGARALETDAAVLAVVSVAVTPVALSHLWAAGLPAYALVLARLVETARRTPAVWAGIAGLHLLWLIPPVSLSEQVGRNLPERLLLSCTLIAGAITAVLALRPGRAGPRGEHH